MPTVVMPTVEVVYRGPFQGRRIAFLLDGLAPLGGRTRFTWLCPHDGWQDQAAFLDEYMAERGVEARVVDGRAQGLPSALRVLAGRGSPRPDLALAIGFTSLPYARAVRAERLVWCVNGIPEERLLHRNDLRQRRTVDAMWRSTRIGRTPDAAVTVSRPMAQLLRERTGEMATFVAPTVVDRATFQPRPAGPGVLTYIGSGAPWQDLPLLADVWSEVHRLDPSLRFRVVSRDERAEVVRRGLPDDVVDMVAAHSPAEVAEHLRDTQLGFIVRRPDIVNTVAYPTKFGEYVASGVGVVTSDIGWDIAGLVRSTGCGVVLDVDEPPAELAEHVVGFVAAAGSSPGELTAGCERAATELDRTVHAKRLAEFLAEL